MNLTWLAPIGSLLALGFAGYFIKCLMKESEGTDKMKEIAASIREGANAYLGRQYKVVGIYFAVVFILMLIMWKCGFLSIFTPFAFLTGGLFSGLCGWLGMKVATQANSRTTHACTKSLNAGLKIAFRSGAVMGLFVVGFARLDISLGWFFLNWWYTEMDVIVDLSTRLQMITAIMLTFGMGASSQALFARLGGGAIFLGCAVFGNISSQCIGEA